MNSFGRRFRITTFGESHGPAVGVVIDGCPAGVALDIDALQHEMDRRRPGQSKITTRRDEADQLEVLSGLFEGKTTGAPLTLMVRNQDQRSADYEHLREAYRPSHADYTYAVKYGHRDHRGGGRSSARETAARVAAGAVAKQLLGPLGVSIVAWVSQVHDIVMPESNTLVTQAEVEANIVRCPDAATAERMIALIDQVRKEGDTVGGVVSARIDGVPAGWGSPVFAKLHAELGAAMLGINACKGFEYGSGFAGTHLRGSQHNDLYYRDGERIRTRSNHSGGIQGGISNGEPITFRAAFKPVATILRPQASVNAAGEAVTVEGRGRHDPCVLPRAVPIVEAMAALVLVDAWMEAS
jgi:chorismate synthase